MNLKEGLKKVYNAWSGYALLKSNGIEKSKVRPLRAAFAAATLGIAGLSVVDAFAGPDAMTASAQAAGALMLGAALLWGTAGIEVGAKKACGYVFTKKPEGPTPPAA
jgi:hypothetical protein